MNSKSRTIAKFGIIAALVVVAIIIETAVSVGFAISIAAVTITIVLVVCQTNDLKTAIFVTTTFGMLSFLRSFIIASPTAWLFQNPLVSVAPRIIIGFTCYYSLKLFKKLFAKYKSNIAKTLPFIFSGAIGVLTNTVLVLSMMAVFDYTRSLAEIIAAIILINFLSEILAGVLIVPAASKALLRARRNIDINPSTDNKQEIQKPETQNSDTQQDNL